ncbi:response regulator [Pseudonocardia endophytica]|uniref:LuxR family two component transcriptional regulator n=1 Tax=Pseudonocardia endophytica TaxID=401976 RepID=A0A4R1HZE0_PSEEN|nr:response regulator transcription factor [Pseudonocardia endophytica]TCK26953.1 LuxR family two component transcriptional regulator [Pseudonocardia endophytica]
MTVRLLLADDQEMVRRGFRMILESEPGLEVVAEAADGAEAVEAVRAHRPDVALVDIQMPGTDGLTATERILALDGTDTRVVILTTFERDDYVFRALGAGASGFVLKTSPPDELIAAVHAAARGDALLSPSVTRRVVGEIARRNRPPSEPGLQRLTGRETEVLRLLGRGLANAEIAAEIAVSEATVKTHVSSVLSKLGLRDRVQAVVLAHEQGLT